ncbi:MAG TPA: class I SAM-dependent methyltransferase [Candidatus Limnocylindrales bacterium]|nr:class I SAM-dependent methyltransferase [Candidatus Limnocylindrales bacterium]
MPDGWEWDRTLFQGSAAYYQRGRLPYAPGFAERLAKDLGWDGRGRLIDIGCGPGTVTLALAPLFAEVVGVDPDEDMLVEAAQRAKIREVTNARWVTARAEDLSAGLGVFRVALFAQSFHWMDRDQVAATVMGMLEPGGVIVHLSIKELSAEPAPPYGRISALVREYLGPVRRAGRGLLVNGTPDGEDVVLARAGFVDFKRYLIPAGQVVDRTTDDLVAWTFSRSDSAPHLFGDRLDDFERSLRAMLHETSSDDHFMELLPPTEVMTWRKPS